MSILSRRAQANSKKESSLLVTGFTKCHADPYLPADNPGGIINLGTSENLIVDDLMIPKLESLTTITYPELRYFPFSGFPEFRAEIARFLMEKARADVMITADEVSVANGCSSVFCSLSYMIGDAGDHYLIPTPYYGMTATYMGSYMGLRPIGVELDSDNMVSVALLAEAYDRAVVRGQRVCGVVLINPHNPTGAVYSRQLVLEILEFAKSHSLHVIIDEIYMLSVFEEGGFESCLSYSREWPDPTRTHFMWGFSKDFAMSGSRCAAFYTRNREIHATFGRDVAFFHSVPGMVQMKLCALLRDSHWVDGYLKESRRRLQHHATIVMNTLDNLGISYVKPTGTLYLWADFTPLFKTFPSDEEANTIFYKMIDHRIYIPSCKGFNGTDPKFFRIVYSVPEGYLIEAMRRFDGFVKAYKN